MRRFILITIVVLMAFTGRAQQVDDLQKMMADMVEAMAGQQPLNADYEELVNDLIRLSQHPLNLNKAQKEDLEQLFFLSDYQIENLLYYRYVNGPLYSVYELQAVEQMDSMTIAYMLPFVEVKPLEYKRKMRVYGNVMGRWQSTVQKPQGYRPKNDSVAPAYVGDKAKWMLRGRVYFGDRAEAGFTLEKDQGEKAFPHYFPAADFSSAFVQFSKPLPFIDIWIVGDYRLSFGQGLGVWTDMAFSKSTETNQLRRRARGVRPYTSVNESSFLRGTAVTFRYGRWSVSPFVSYKKRDAALPPDSLDAEIGALRETGYHRTAGEVEGRYTINETVYGTQLSWQNQLLHLDAGYVNWQVDQPIAPKDHLRDKYRFSGDKQTTAWLSHSLFLNRLMVFGEVAVQSQGEYGVFQGLTYNAGSDVLASLAYRRYSKGYTAILSNPFSESSTRGGESGVFAAISFKPAAGLTLKAYADIFRYAWLRYNVYRPSEGFEWFSQADYRINAQHTMYLRYKSTQKAINSSHSKTVYEVVDYQKENVRLFYAFQPNEQWRFQTQLEQSFYRRQERSEGWMAFQDIRYKHDDFLSASLRYVFFAIDDYESRIYSYEPDVLYAFTIPAYMNRGTRLIFNMNVSLLKNLRIWGRLAHTSYANRDDIGSGYQRIDGNQLTEWKVQLQYRF
ncbi:MULTISPECIES: helix-hairpin-helix domain-containing protein [unclassified Carboxylicivirga]|uniref:helix-hairpin-helix domain-containing protein n=1 Tax=Carboxylicivirga TaxID=1628153 RepID=UPI003D347294